MTMVEEVSSGCTDGHKTKPTEIGELPSDWNVSPLADIARVDVGYAFKSQWFKDSSDVALLRGENVGYGQINWSDRKSISSDFADEFSQYELADGDIVIGMDRTFTKSGTKISRVTDQDCPALLVQRVGRFVPLNCDLNFLWSLLSSPKYQSALVLQQKGMDIPHLSRNEIVAPLVAVPPTLAEQKAIASALGDADALIESLEKLLAKKRQIKQGAMQELLTGRRRLPGFNEKWIKVSLGEIGEAVAGLTYAPGDVAESGTLVLRASNVQNSRLDFSDSVYVDMDAPERVFVREGDILICVRNGSRDLIGKCALIDNHSEAMNHAFGAFMCVYRTEYSAFVFQQFQSSNIADQIHAHLGATINQITNKSLKSFALRLPSEPEQAAITEVLADLDNQILQLENRLQKSRQLKHAMMQQLLTGKTRLVESTSDE